MLAVAAIFPLLVGSAQTDISVPLRFDGQPLAPAAPPDYTCFSDTLEAEGERAGTKPSSAEAGGS